MDILKHYLLYAVLIVAIWAGVTYLPRITTPRVTVGENYFDVSNLSSDQKMGLTLDRFVTVEGFARGDGVCFRIDRTPEHQALFGWVAGLPGDEIRISGGRLLANGQPPHENNGLPLPDLGPLTVPSGHLFVVSSGHVYDSIANGPLPRTAIRGRAGGLP